MLKEASVKVKLAIPSTQELDIKTTLLETSYMLELNSSITPTQNSYPHKALYSLMETKHTDILNMHNGGKFVQLKEKLILKSYYSNLLFPHLLLSKLL